MDKVSESVHSLCYYAVDYNLVNLGRTRLFCTSFCLCFHREDMIERLCRVFGVDYAEDPDDSYVLTSDNFLKMMAIHMRFRYEFICGM